MDNPIAKKPDNPFSLSFGKEPQSLIPRPVVVDEVLSAFKSDTPPTQIYIITGVRGSGKTVTLSNIARLFENEDQWIVIDLNPERDLLESLAAKLYDAGKLRRLFLKANFSFSFKGLGLTISGDKPISDVESLLDLMLAELKRQGKRVLITIDEVSNNQFTKVFAHAFQGFLRKDFGVFLLMTGLYQNISLLQEEKTLTFLYRSPKIFLTPLNFGAIASSYSSLFKIDDEAAAKLAKLTGGYAFAYQVLGYLLFEKGKRSADAEILSLYDQYLEDFVYEKVFSELSSNDRKVLLAIDGQDEAPISFILKQTGMKPNVLSVYRSRLIRRGIIESSQRGSIRFALPRFFLFLKRKESADACY